MTIAWTFYLLALFLASLSFRGDGRRRKYIASRLRETAPDGACPPATVIVPVKGPDEGLQANLVALAGLDYPDYELIVVVREAADLPGGLLPLRARLVVAGGGASQELRGTGHKIQNLLAAVEAARDESEILAFADSDGRPERGWLRALAGPLSEPGVGATTGYRWYLPEPPDFWSHLRGVWNAAVAGTFGPGDNAFCWGGAMAIRRSTFEKAKVRSAWVGHISDDFQMTKAVHDARLQVAFAPGALVPCFDHTGAAELLQWTSRQMMITRFYHPKLWWQAVIAHIVYCGAMVAGYLISPWALTLLLGLGILKAVLRARMLGQIHSHRPDVTVWHALLVTFGTWLWLVSLLWSALGSTLRWRGVSYSLRR
jgi:cellulose synthase/poly-beta-1,6-N-acetylglucosamine synthase-like glycosyltransferase